MVRGVCRQLALYGALALTMLSLGCGGGSGASYGSNDPGGVSTVISGPSDTSGVSAGTALQPPAATPTRAP
jgi:hypothetical protein